MIALNTIIWEGNYNDVLKDSSFFFTFKNKFIKQKNLIVNNIKEENTFLEVLESFKEKYNFNVFFVDDFKEEAKQYFNLDINESTLGYYYTIPYFIAILKCKQPFLFNVSSDCDVYLSGDDYFIDSINELEKNNDAITTTLAWRTEPNVGLDEQNSMFEKFNKKEELDKFYYSVGNSDQVFLTNIEKIKKVNFNTEHSNTDNFPEYGGNCFEKRLCSYFLTEKKYRLIYKKYNYVHNI